MHPANLRKRAAVAQASGVQSPLGRPGKLAIVAPVSDNAESASLPLLRKRAEVLLQDSMHLRKRLGRTILELESTIERIAAHVSQQPRLVDRVHVDLTRREAEVLRLIAEGNSSKQIAFNLGISFKTAVCHRAKIMQKLNIHETAGLVRYAIRCRLVHP